MAKENTSRRQFLRNTALTGLAVGLLQGKTFAITPKYKVLGECNPTTLDYYGQGPFYTAGAPLMVDNQLALIDEPGTRLTISGLVQTLDCTAPIADTKFDVWHANNNGAYDNTGYNLRGVTYSNAEGFYVFETILPGKYLNGAAYRPSHIHFKITPPGFPTVITQLYFEGDTDIPGDAAASITSGAFDATHRIIALTENIDGSLSGTWDIAVNGDGTVGVADAHLEKGIIYSVSPNPFTNRVEINYGIFHEAKISIQVLDMKGARIAVLDEQYLQPEKYIAVWQPDDNLSKGIYFIALKINDLQVHYLKVVKM